MKNLKKEFFKIIFSVSMVLFLSACGSGSENSINNQPSISETEEENAQQNIIGYLVDAPVANMNYLCGGAEGVTDNEGKFECPTLPVTFKIDSLVIAKVETLPEDKTVYPQDLVGVPREEISHPEVLKVASFLQSLDSDGDLSTINIPDNLTLDVNQTLLEMTPEETHLLLASQNITPVALDEAEAHLQESMGMALVEEEENNRSNNINPPPHENNQTNNETLGSNDDNNANTASNYYTNHDTTQIVENNISLTTSELNSTLIAEENLTSTISEINTTSTAEQNLSTSDTNTTAEDTTPPTITLKGDNPLILEYGESYQEEGFSATDNIDGNITDQVIITDDINLSKLGEYTVLYHVEDSSHNETNRSRVVKVIDTIPPTIHLLGDTNITLDIREEYQEEGFYAVDNYDGNLTERVSITSNLNSLKSGEYEVVYHIIDSSGNEANRTRKITIKADTTPPTITLQGENPTILEYGERYKESGYSATDNIDGNITDRVIIQNDINYSKLGAYQVTYSVKDNARNELNVSRIIKIVDTTPPVITLFGNSNTTLNIEETYQEEGYTATDNYDGEITRNVTIQNDLNNSKVGEYTIIYNVVDSSGNSAERNRTIQIIDPYPYIPKGSNLDYNITFRFLQKTTFGPTQELIEEVQREGIIPWLTEQLNQTYELNDSLTYQTLKMGQTINPFAYNHEISEYMAEDTTLYLPPWGSDHVKVRDYFISSWAKDVFFGEKQVAMRVAYALSQIIVASNSSEVFYGKYQGLAAYYDLMKKHALGNYGELLKEVSTNPGMGYYLTFYGNQKKHLNSKGEWVYPDENYAREVMQLFSISPFLLNMDGTAIVNSNQEPIPSYTQDDVNELARVFTGLDFRLASDFGNTGTRGGDLIHKMECHNEYHDTEAKTLLGKSIPAGGDCYGDVNKAIDILMAHQNTAPFIAKKLIMRLAKSNPSPEYVRRVAEVFENNGKGEKGDIKETVRAIYLDEEFWDDIVNKRSMKYKEPIIAFTQMARTFHVKPYPKWHLLISSSDTVEIRDLEVVLEDTGLIWIDSRLVDIFGQGPTQSKTVFNFYSDDYVPSDDYFLNNNYVAPEIQIQTDGGFVAYHNYMFDVMLNEKNYALNKHGVNLYNPYEFKVYTDLKEFGNDLDMVYHIDKFYFDLTPYYKLVEDTLREEVEGEDLEEILDKAHDEQYLFSLELREKAIAKVVDLLDKELAGNGLNSEFKQMLVEKYAVKLRYWDSRDQRLFYMLVLKLLVQMVVIYDDYKVE